MKISKDYNPDFYSISGYESPITVLTNHALDSITEQADGVIYKAVIDIGVEVDKEELQKALKYDRMQYQTGYRQGYNDALQSYTYEKGYEDGWEAALQHVMNMLKGEE